MAGFTYATRLYGQARHESTALKCRGRERCYHSRLPPPTTMRPIKKGLEMLLSRLIRTTSCLYERIQSRLVVRVNELAKG